MEPREKLRSVKKAEENKAPSLRETEAQEVLELQAMEDKYHTPAPIRKIYLENYLENKAMIPAEIAGIRTLEVVKGVDPYHHNFATEADF